MVVRQFVRSNSCSSVCRRYVGVWNHGKRQRVFCRGSLGLRGGVCNGTVRDTGLLADRATHLAKILAFRVVDNGVICSLCGLREIRCLSSTIVFSHRSSAVIFVPRSVCFSFILRVSVICSQPCVSQAVVGTESIQSWSLCVASRLLTWSFMQRAAPVIIKQFSLAVPRACSCGLSRLSCNLRMFQHHLPLLILGSVMNTIQFGVAFSLM